MKFSHLNFLLSHMTMIPFYLRVACVEAHSSIYFLTFSILPSRSPKMHPMKPIQHLFPHISFILIEVTIANSVSRRPMTLTFRCLTSFFQNFSFVNLFEPLEFQGMILIFIDSSTSFLFNSEWKFEQEIHSVRAVIESWEMGLLSKLSLSLSILSPTYFLLPL